MTTTDDHDGGGAEVEQDGVFIDIDEDDPFEAVALKAITEDGVGMIVGEIEAEDGRYELKKVGDVCARGKRAGSGSTFTEN